MGVAKGSSFSTIVAEPCCSNRRGRRMRYNYISRTHGNNIGCRTSEQRPSSKNVEINGPTS
jgi:hypothetical protein